MKPGTTQEKTALTHKYNPAQNEEFVNLHLEKRKTGNIGNEHSSTLLKSLLRFLPGYYSIEYLLIKDLK